MSRDALQALRSSVISNAENIVTLSESLNTIRPDLYQVTDSRPVDLCNFRAFVCESEVSTVISSCTLSDLIGHAHYQFINASSCDWIIQFDQDCFIINGSLTPMMTLTFGQSCEVICIGRRLLLLSRT